LISRRGATQAKKAILFDENNNRYYLCDLCALAAFAFKTDVSIATSLAY
jgi:hypothetical protein